MDSTNLKEKIKKDSIAFICKYLKGQQQYNHIQLEKNITNICTHIPTLYECMKIMYFVFKNQVAFPAAIRFVEIIKLILATCQMPCINLVEVYILPYLYIAARQFAISDPNKRYPNPKSTYQRFLQHYESNCFATIIQWGMIKSKRLYQNKQMQQNSIFFQCMKNLLILISKQAEQNVEILLKEDWKKFINDYCVLKQETIIKNIQQYNKKFKQNISKYGSYQKSKTAKKYSKFFISIFQEQIKEEFKDPSQKEQQDTSKIYNLVLKSSNSFNFPITELPQFPQLNIYSLFQTLDPVLTYPLNQTIFSILEQKQLNFTAMKEALRILTRLICWGDLQAYLNVIYSEQIHYLGKRLLQVKGYLSLKQGQNIFPEIAENSSKLSFYMQYLNFLQIFGVCKISEIDQELSNMKIRRLRKQLRDLKYIFPCNLFQPKIKIQFNNNLKLNAQRNQKMFQQIQKISINQSLKSIAKSFEGSMASSKYTKSAQLMKSINIVQVLKQQILDLIKTIERQYQKYKQYILKGADRQRIDQIQHNLKYQMKTLSSELANNQNQTDPYIQKYLEDTTNKGRHILNSMTKFFQQKYKNVKIQRKNCFISPKNKRSEQLIQQIQRTDYLSDLQLQLSTLQRINNERDKLRPDYQLIITPKIQRNHQNHISSNNGTFISQNNEETQNLPNLYYIKSQCQYGIYQQFSNQNYKSNNSLNICKFSLAINSIKQKNNSQLKSQIKAENNDLGNINKNIQKMLTKVQIHHDKYIAVDQNIQNKFIKKPTSQRKLYSFRQCIKDSQCKKQSVQLATKYLSIRSSSKSKSKLRVFSKQSNLKQIRSQFHLQTYKIKSQVSNSNSNYNSEKIKKLQSKDNQPQKYNKNGHNSNIFQKCQYYNTKILEQKQPIKIQQTILKETDKNMQQKIAAKNNKKIQKRKGIQLVQIR